MRQFWAHTVKGLAMRFLLLGMLALGSPEPLCEEPHSLMETAPTGGRLGPETTEGETGQLPPMTPADHSP